MSQLKPLQEVVCSYFDAENLNYDVVDDKTLSLQVQAEGVSIRCIVRTSEEQRQFIFMSSISGFAPESARIPVAEYLTRANYGLMNGNFEMDFRDGELRYKMSALLPDMDLSEEAVRILFALSVGMWAKYYPGLMAVIYGGKEPALAIAEAEGEADD